MTAVERIIARAEAEVGYKEKASKTSDLDDKTADAGSKNWNKYARDLDELGVFNGKKNGYDWCDIFFDWNFITEFGKDLGLQVICQPDKSCGAGVNWSAKYYKAKGRLDNEPQAGDQVFFIDSSDGLYYHTGLVTEVTKSKIYTIEGNSGNAVAKRSYARNSTLLGAFGHPRWELVGETTESPNSQADASLSDSTASQAQTSETSTDSVDNSADELAVGDRVKLTALATVFGKDTRFSEWVYRTKLYVRAIDGDKITVSTLKIGAITGRVHRKYLTKV